MANIFLTKKCNLNCSYCFAKESIADAKNEISIENFKKALRFIKKDRTDEIGLIGGEPLLHSNFDEILEILVKDDDIKKVLVYTNGIELNKHFEYLQKDKFNLLINCNSPDNCGSFYEKLTDNISLFKNCNKRKIALGLNVYSDKVDYNYIFKLLERTNNKVLRVSISFSNQEKEQTGNVISCFKKIKSNLFNIFENCYKNGITPYYDCNRMPDCILSNKDKRLILKIHQNAKIENNNDYDLIKSCKECKPVIDILPDLKAIRCFGFPEYEKIEIEKFKSLTHLKLYFFNKVDIYSKISYLRKECENCKLRLLNKCGVCHSYKIKSIDSIKAFSKEIPIS